MLNSQPRLLRSSFVFFNPDTSEPWVDFRDGFDNACEASGLDELWFHDLRRSFITKARRAGVPESVIMRITGHKTRKVFERYNIINEDDLKHAVDLIEAATSEIVGHDQDTVDVRKKKGNEGE